MASSLLAVDPPGEGGEEQFEMDRGSHGADSARLTLVP